MNNSYRNQAHKLVEKMTLQEKLSQINYDAPAIERLGIPAYNWWSECLHGLARNGVATVFPQAIAIAATFDLKAMKEMAHTTAVETRARYNEIKKFGDTKIFQGITMCAPNINIFRDPRWGRGQETYGEDPVLTALMGEAFVKGLQGEDEYRMLDTNLKHYAVHSGPEALRHGFNAYVSQKELFRTYLWAFEYIIKNANPSAVMAAYSGINGIPCSGNKKLLTDILRDRFGFKGYVTSDAGGIKDLHTGHKITSNSVESAALAMNAGCDLNIGDAFKSMGEAVEQGLISEETITEATERLFEARYRLGMFDPDCRFNSIGYEVIDCEDHRNQNRELARKSIVLLKNNGILPLCKTTKIAVIGPNADCIPVLKGNYCGTPSEYATPLQGIKRVANEKVLFSEGSFHLENQYKNWHENPLREGIIAAKKADVVVLCVGLTPQIEGEENDALAERTSIELPLPQQVLCESILNTGKPTILVNISGSAVALTKYVDRCAAVIQCFYPGAEGGNALADVIFGDYNPSGKLPITFYASTDDLPAFEDYSMANRTYRFFKGEPLYPFGFGLSYSDFGYKFTRIPKKISANEDLHFSLEIQNKGAVSGDAVVEIYLQPVESNQKDEVIRQLVAIDRQHIKKNETKNIEITVPHDMLTTIDENGYKINREGVFELFAGGNQPDIVSMKLGGSNCDCARLEIIP